MKQFGNYVIALCLRGIGLVCGNVSIKLRIKAGAAIGFVLRLSSKKRFRITYQNIQLAFPEKTNAWHLKTARGSYRNLGIILAEIVSFPWLNDSKIKELIHYKNIELIDKAASRGKGLILLSGHYGNWEMLAYSAGLLSGISIGIVVIHQHNPYADAHINTFRTRHNNSIIPTANAARQIVQKLRKGETVALLADQAADGAKDIFVDFFGRQAATYEAPAALALKFGSPIIIGFPKREENGTYWVELKEITHDDLEYSKDGIVELTKRHVDALEQAVRENPELWAWQHNRWKK
ncbi:MAG: lysophospholipid acyltransferase family protein [Ignavibacteriae bacterium]|nr:lysophospholipid acyltransferase family protein [Ignavibacteriota bacterium]